MRLLRRHPVRTEPVDLRQEFLATWDRIEIHGQHLHDVTDGRIMATEALLRWRRNAAELWAAGMVLPVAEEMARALPLTMWATELAVAAWTNGSHRRPGRRLVLNLHPSQFEHPGLVDDVTLMLHHCGVEPSDLVLDIPDRLGREGCRRAVEALGPFVDRGARLALDDHRGTASNTDPDPSWLPTGSLVKLDTALVMACDEPLGHDLLEMTADTLHARGYELVAESVERESQLAAVRDCHIAYAQGYLLTPPVAMI